MRATFHAHADLQTSFRVEQALSEPLIALDSSDGAELVIFFRGDAQLEALRAAIDAYLASPETRAA